jgi:pyruvate-ferredoxin/flavodoxin oxidoreductase
VETTLQHLHKLDITCEIKDQERYKGVSSEAPDFVKDVIGKMVANDGDVLLVSAFLVDGTGPSGITRWGKFNIAEQIPIWNSEICIQYNKCIVVCRHAAIRSKFYDSNLLKNAPDIFQSVDFQSKENPGCKFSIRIAPEDCTGCSLGINVCPVKDKLDDTKKFEFFSL